MKQKSFFSSLFVIWLTSALSGCGDPLKYGQELQDARVLGVRVVSDAEGLASLIPGQEAQFSVLLAGPEGPFEARVGYEVCLTEPTDRGVPLCGEVYAQGTTGLAALPEMSATLPEAAAPGAKVAVLGVACQSGDPRLAPEPLYWSCSDGAEPLNFSFDAQVLAPGRDNHAPSFSGLVIQMGERPAVPQPVDTPADCSDETLVFAADTDVPLELYFGESVREAFDDELDGPTLETIQVSHFATVGRFERQFSILDPNEEARTVVNFRTPAEPGPAKIYAVVRDDFGGVDWLSLNVCVE